MYTHVSVCAHGPPYGHWFESKLKPSIHDVHCELMCMYVPMCPHVGIGSRNSHYLQYVLSTVNSPMCMYVPIFPYLANGLIHTTTSETGCSLCTSVSVYAHVPTYGQWFKSKLKPPIHYEHCEIMCMYVAMCPHVGIGCRNSHYLQYMLSTVNSPMCIYVPISPHVAKDLIHN